jgi:hypothetical protein
MKRLLRTAHERVGWGVADQALSSLTNLGLGVMVARSVSTSEFGAFSIAFLTYVSALGLSRALTSEPLVVRFSTATPERWRDAAGSAGGAAFVLGAAIGVGCIGVGLLVGDTLGAALVPLGLMLPGLLVQDLWRFAFFARSTGSAAFLNDLVWAAVLFPGLGALIAFDESTVEWIVLVWGAAATAAAIVGVRQARTLPHPRAVSSWWKAHRDLAARYVGEFAVTSGATQAATYGIGAISGLAAVGALRGVDLLFAPIKVLFAGLVLTEVPHGARILPQSSRGLYWNSLALSGGTAAAGALWGGVLLLIPSIVGRSLLGETWAPARELVPALTAMTVGRGITLGAITGLRALAAARRSLLARAISSAGVLVGGLAGAAIAGAVGAAWGFAASTVPEMMVWWSEYRRGLAEWDAGRVPAEATSVLPEFEAPIDPWTVDIPTETSE